MVYDGAGDAHESSEYDIPVLVAGSGGPGFVLPSPNVTLIMARPNPCPMTRVGETMIKMNRQIFATDLNSTRIHLFQPWTFKT
jgi:hypothetical protein